MLTWEGVGVGATLLPALYRDGDFAGAAAGVDTCGVTAVGRDTAAGATDRDGLGVYERDGLENDRPLENDRELE